MKLFRQILKDPNSNHPLKDLLSEEDLDRLAENPPSMEDVQKFMQYFFGNANFNPFAGINPNVQSPPPSPPKSSPKKGAANVAADPNLIVDTFEFDDEVHVLIGTPRADLEFKTGIKKRDPKSVALIIRDKQGNILQVVKLPSAVDKKSKRVTYQNGTYEIVYQKP